MNKKLEREAAIQNLEYLLKVLPMIEQQRSTIIHAIKLLREIDDASPQR